MLTPAINILPLTSGDRLTRREFERRYAAMPEHFRAELIEGVVYVASPVRFASHGSPHIQLPTWLGVYCAATPGVSMADNASVLEYLIWQVYEQRLDWFYLHEDEYEPLLPDADGVTRSRAFLGLHLDAAALLAGDLARVLAALQEGLRTGEHAEFADRIRAAPSS